MTAPSRILVVGPSWIGDMVMAQSLFRTIMRDQPAVELSVLAHAWSEPVLARMPEVADIINMPVGHGSLEFGARRRLARKLRARDFDQAIILPGSYKSALVPWFAGIPRRTGFKGECRWGLINDMRRLDESALVLQVQRYVALGLERDAPPPAGFPYPELVVDPVLQERTIRKLGLEREGPVLALCPGAAYGPAKRWPAEHFAETARRMLARGWQVWLFGSAADRDLNAGIDRMTSGRCRNLSGETTLAEAIDLLQLAAHVVSNDSGLLHVAAAVGCHVVALYGPTTDGFTPPLTERRSCLSMNLACSPCFERRCPLRHNDCMNRLLPERVVEHLLSAQGGSVSPVQG